jgi:hypothetical protein
MTDEISSNKFNCRKPKGKENWILIALLTVVAILLLTHLFRKPQPVTVIVKRPAYQYQGGGPALEQGTRGAYEAEHGFYHDNDR